MDGNEKNLSEYNLSVSQFAKLCGTTRDTLRHYYEIGILLPRIDENNGYHYYSSSQISSLYFITSLRKAGCSLKEISELIHDSTREKIQSVVGEKINDMQKELVNLQQKVNTLQTSLWLLEKYEENKNDPPQIKLLENISFFKTPVSEKDNAKNASAIASDLTHHLSLVRNTDGISSFPMGATISVNDLFNDIYKYNSIVSISQNKPDNINTFPLPSKKVVLCCHDHTKNDITFTYKQIVKFIKKEQLTVCSDLFVISLINIYNEEQKHTYFKYLFICVE